MGSDPQYAKYPDLTLSQDIFNLSNPSCPAPVRQGSLKKLRNAIEENNMAPLYRHLAHPVEGILNMSGESAPQAASSNTPTVASDLLANRRQSVQIDLSWDEKLYETMLAENKKELDAFQKEEDEAAEAAGDTEVQAAQGKRAEFWARVGDKVRSQDTVFLLAESVPILAVSDKTNALRLLCRTKPLLPTKPSSKTRVY